MLRKTTERSVALAVAISYTATVRGTINGRNLEVVGRGSISESGGLTEGEYKIEQFPPDTDPAFLTAVLITGYPNASRTTGAVTNPFQGRSYSYCRQLRFSSGHSMSFVAQCFRHESHLESTFDLCGLMPDARVNRVLPLVESWTSATAAPSLSGMFLAGWGLCDGALIFAEARTNYGVATAGGIFQYRLLDIDYRSSQNQIQLKQTSITCDRLAESGGPCQDLF
jgi:hypothetical protein